MDSWTVFSLAVAGVILSAWLGRGNTHSWYLSCIVPLLYGGVVAWMFRGDDPMLALRVLIFGTALPILLLALAWVGGQRPGGPGDAGDEAERRDRAP